MNEFIVSIPNKKERKICEFEMDLKNFLVCALNLSNNDLIFCLKARSENGCGN